MPAYTEEEDELHNYRRLQKGTMVRMQPRKMGEEVVVEEGWVVHPRFMRTKFKLSIKGGGLAIRSGKNIAEILKYPKPVKEKKGR